jgi:hypothetical protein
LKFLFVDRESRLVRNRGAEHFETDRRVGGLIGLLVRRDSGGHENDLLELQCFQRFTSQDQMGVVNRIERAAVNAEFPQRRSRFLFASAEAELFSTV